MINTNFFLLIIFLVYCQVGLAFDWQGHRGARGLYPENTIGAMEVALRYPIKTLELDVVVSKDLKVVVSHEPWMNEAICINPKGQKIQERKENLYQLTYDEIKMYNCGLTHPRFPNQHKVQVGKPTLDKLISVIEEKIKKTEKSDITYNIEIKSTPEDEKNGFQPDFKIFSDIVIKTIRAHLSENRYVIQSFDWRVLRYIHQRYPEVRLAALWESDIDPSKLLNLLGFSPYIFSPDYKFLKKDQIAFFHEKKIKVIPWTVNTVEEMQRLKGLGVDGLITDYPNLISEVDKKSCKTGKSYFEGRCVKLPKHSLPSGRNPGWICKPGYVQKRSLCTKIKVPKNGYLLPNGKNWECKSGYRSYRNKCLKVD